MTITLRQESATGAVTKNDTLTYQELDNSFIDLLQNKIIPIQIDAETGSVKVGQAQSNGVFNITGSTGVSTAVTEDSVGNANLTISLDQVSGSNLNVTIYAKATESLSAGDVVMFAGVQGDHLLVKKAVIDDSAGAFIAEYIVGMVETPLKLSGRVKASSNSRSMASRKVIISRTGSQRVRLDIVNLLIVILGLRS